MFSITRTALRQSCRRATVMRPAMVAPLYVRSLATESILLEVTRVIRTDHDNIRDLFERYKLTTALPDKKLIANTLVREIAIHADAEEASVYSDYGRVGLKYAADLNRDEHTEIVKLVSRAEEKLSHHHEQFDEVLSDAVNFFLNHASEEEILQHPTIREVLSPEESDRIARDFIKARAAPRPDGILSAVEGLYNRLQDRAREYVDLKHAHPAL